MTQLKRIIPKWEKSGQGDGGHEGNDNDEIPQGDAGKDGDSHSSSSSSSSSRSSINSHHSAQPVVVKKWGEFKNRSCFSILKLRDFFKGTNAYVLYCWYIIQKHDLITCSMNMLADGVCSRDGARGIPSVITKRNEQLDEDYDETEDGRSSIGDSVQSKSATTSTRSAKMKGEGDRLSASIRDHGSKLVEYAKIHADEIKRNREYAEEQAKRQRIDDIDEVIDKLRAEKRGFVIQLASIPPGSNTALEEAYKSSIDEINTQIEVKNKLKEDASGFPTPIKNNLTPTSSN